MELEKQKSEKSVGINGSVADRIHVFSTVHGSLPRCTFLNGSEMSSSARKTLNWPSSMVLRGQLMVMHRFWGKISDESR